MCCPADPRALNELLEESQDLQADALRTIRYAVWQHGAAADELQATRAIWTVEDLVAELGNVR